MIEGILREPESLGELRRHLKNDKLAVMFSETFFSVMYKEDEELIATTIQQGMDEIVVTGGDFEEVLKAMGEIQDEWHLPDLIEDSKYNLNMHLQALLMVKDWLM